MCGFRAVWGTGVVGVSSLLLHVATVGEWNVWCFAGTVVINRSKRDMLRGRGCGQ